MNAGKESTEKLCKRLKFIIMTNDTRKNHKFHFEIRHNFSLSDITRFLNTDQKIKQEETNTLASGLCRPKRPQS